MADAGLSRAGAEGGEEGAQARPGAGAGADGAGLRRARRDRHRQGEAGVPAGDRARTPPIRCRASASASPPSAPATWRRGGGDIEIAVGLDPDNALLRSYLGKAYFEERTTNPLTIFEELVKNFPNQENTLAAEQFAIAKRLDPNDPTPWLYNAIRLQSENRPVEALRDIEKSIELNDNRAVYRSRELLDQDQAARGTSLARIYNDLGFEQLGINEATKSLSLRPGQRRGAPVPLRRLRDPAASRDRARQANCCRRSSCRTSTSTRCSRA